MTISMYQAFIPVFVHALTNCRGILAKGEVHAAANGIDPAVLLEARLAPDMVPLHRQVQIAADGARGAAVRLAGLPFLLHYALPNLQFHIAMACAMPASRWASRISRGRRPI